MFAPLAHLPPTGLPRLALAWINYNFVCTRAFAHSQQIGAAVGSCRRKQPVTLLIVVYLYLCFFLFYVLLRFSVYVVVTEGRMRTAWIEWVSRFWTNKPESRKCDCYPCFDYFCIVFFLWLIVIIIDCDLKWFLESCMVTTKRELCKVIANFRVGLFFDVPPSFFILLITNTESS